VTTSDILGFNAPVEIMKLTLTFDGRLPSGNASRPEDKWRIRHAIHDQLSELWSIDPVLQEARDNYVPTHGGLFLRGDQYHALEKRKLSDSAPKSERLYLFAPIEKHDKEFLPLVRNSAALVCSMDILFLRRGSPGRIFEKGRKQDLDNRLKTLFDGLRMPEHKEEVESGGDAVPRPMYCLLEDDELITGLSIRTGQLLAATNKHPDEVRLTIEVTVKATQSKLYNLAFQGD
jgi:hypothetical protein